eukprot:2387859-Pleurochrysis_carterae.AAC.12
MARSPISNMVSIMVATGTTLTVAADRIHPIGSRGIFHIALHQRILLAEGRNPLTHAVISRYPSVIAVETET